MTYSKQQRKKFLMHYLDKLVDHLEIKPWKEWLIELRNALDIEIFTYEHNQEAKQYWKSLVDLISNN